MKLTYEQAVSYYASLQALSSEKNGKTPNISMKAYLLIVTMLGSLNPVRDTFEKTSLSRFKLAAGENPTIVNNQPVISDHEKIAIYQQEIRELLNTEINVAMPKEKIKEEDLNILENNIPVALIVQLSPLIEFSTQIEMDEEEEAKAA